LGNAVALRLGSGTLMPLQAQGYDHFRTYVPGRRPPTQPSPSRGEGEGGGG
jgi:hypothetical protein